MSNTDRKEKREKSARHHFGAGGDVAQVPSALHGDANTLHEIQGLLASSSF